MRRTRARAAVRDLDALPLPAWDLVDAERVPPRVDGRARPAVVERGDLARLPVRLQLVREAALRPALRPALARERRRGDPPPASDTVAPDHLWFADDIFGLTAEWIQAFADEVARLDARTPFMIQTRVNLMRPATVAALAAAGAEEVWLGVESGSQKILDAMDKGTRIEQVRTATRTLKQHGIRACWFIQLGYLGEEWDDVLMTRDLVRERAPGRHRRQRRLSAPRDQVPRQRCRRSWAPSRTGRTRTTWRCSSTAPSAPRSTSSCATCCTAKRAPDADRAALDLRWAELAAEAAAQVEADVAGAAA